jgi:hypothetical protein
LAAEVPEIELQPPLRASITYSLAHGGEPGTQPSASVAETWGGSDLVIEKRGLISGPNSSVGVTGIPLRSSISACISQAEIAGPVAMTCQIR